MPGVLEIASVAHLTRPSYPDLRLRNQAGLEVPFLLERAVTVRIEKSKVPSVSQVTSLRELQDGSIEIIVRLEKDAPPADGIRFITALRDFEKSVSVFGRIDGGTWTSLVTDALIFDYSRYLDIAEREVSIAENSFREFRITIAEGTDERRSSLRTVWSGLHRENQAGVVERTTVQTRAFRMTELELWHYDESIEAEEREEMEYPVAGIHITEDAEARVSIIQVETHREPVTRFRIETLDRNFSRPVRIEVPDGHTGDAGKSWKKIRQEQAFRFSFRDFLREDLTIEFPEERQARYRIVIENHDNPPLEIGGVVAEGPVYQMALLPEDRSYQLLYGSEIATGPTYDTASVLSAVRRDYPAHKGTLGDEVPNPLFDPDQAKPAIPLFERKSFLYSAIALMVLVLGWGLYRSTQGVGRSEGG